MDEIKDQKSKIKDSAKEIKSKAKDLKQKAKIEGKKNIDRFKVKGDQAMTKVKEIVKEGNARKIIIRDKNDKILAEFPLTLGVVGAVFAPVLAAIGAVVALVSECTIEVERK